MVPLCPAGQTGAKVPSIEVVIFNGAASKKIFKHFGFVHKMSEHPQFTLLFDFLKWRGEVESLDL